MTDLELILLLAGVNITQYILLRVFLESVVVQIDGCNRFTI